MWSRLSVLASVASLVRPGVAQFPPTPEGVTVLKSKFDERIEIRYKEVSAPLSLTMSVNCQLTPDSPASARRRRE